MYDSLLLIDFVSINIYKNNLMQSAELKYICYNEPIEFKFV